MMKYMCKLFSTVSSLKSISWCKILDNFTTNWKLYLDSPHTPTYKPPPFTRIGAFSHIFVGNPKDDERFKNTVKVIEYYQSNRILSK